jgi:1,4-alpha-glucan branching enzyme
MADHPIGHFTFVLHSHIPYVMAHGRWPHGLDWLVEVAAETYLPLLDVLDSLVDEGISPNITLGITPVLAEQLADPDFKTEFLDYLHQKIEAAKSNAAQFQAEGQMHLLGLAYYWQDFYTRIRERFVHEYNQDILAQFKRLQDGGHLELITSAATHGYLPLLLTEESVSAQIAQGVQTYERHFGRKPSGFWLPECAYRPRYAWNPPTAQYRQPKPVERRGIEEHLADQNLAYFFVDAHLLKGGEAIGVYHDRFKGLEELWKQFQKTYQPEDAARTPYAPYLVNSSGKPLEPIAVFSRDAVTGVQVWSGDGGYPGDPFYLEFHKKHYPGNLRYWRVSENKGDLAQKYPYEPNVAASRTAAHAAHFVHLVYRTLKAHHETHGNPGFITAMYDTELFGHWWFEGTEFLYHAIKGLHEHAQIGTTTCRDYLEAHPPLDVISLPEGSWGEGGYHWIWLNEWTAWTWEKIYEAEQTMVELSRDYADNPQVATLLKQAARELLLLQSSDWQFSISTYSSRDYAEQRVRYHHEKFLQIADLIARAARGETIPPEDWNHLGEAEDRDRCFPDVDPRWWNRKEHS